MKTNEKNQIEKLETEMEKGVNLLQTLYETAEYLDAHIVKKVKKIIYADISKKCKELEKLNEDYFKND